MIGKAGYGDDEEWMEEAGYCADGGEEYGDEESLIGIIGISGKGEWTDEPSNNDYETDIDETENEVSIAKYSYKIWIVITYLCLY